MAQFATENIRTVALVGDGAAGKTTLAEALLAKAGAIPAAGSVERGSTVSDFDPIEKTYQHSLRASLMHLETANTRIHLIDTPGFPDFIGQSIGALDAVETAAVVINAAAGPQMIAARMMEWAATRKLCRLDRHQPDRRRQRRPAGDARGGRRTRSARNACRSTCRPMAASAWSTASSIRPATRTSRRSRTRIARSSTRWSRSTRS